MMNQRNVRPFDGVMALTLAAITVVMLDVIAPQQPVDEAVLREMQESAPVGGSWVCTAGIGGEDAVLRPIFGDLDEDDNAFEDDTFDEPVSLAVQPEGDDLDDELFDEEDLSDDTSPNTYTPQPRQAAGIELAIIRPDSLWEVIGSVTIREYQAGVEVHSVTYDTAAASEIRYTPIGSSDAAFVEVSWSGPPVSVSRTWSLPGDPIPATLSGPCQSASAYGFIAPGFSTANGANVRLRIANPYPTSATVSVNFFTPSGVESPTVLSNVSISPFSVLETVVNDVLPELDDVAAQIQVLAGRVAVEGTVFASVTGGATRGMSLLPVLPRERALQPDAPVTDDALGEPRYIHAAAALFDTEDARSWVWFTNVSDRAARVDLVLHTPDGAVPPEGLSEVSIPPRSVRRIALNDTFPRDVTIAGLSGRTDSAAVYMSVASELGGDSQPRGFGITSGQAPDHRWVLSSPRSDRRSEQILITNVSADDVSVDMWFNDGKTITEPEELQARLIPAGASRAFILDELLVPGFGTTVLVRAQSEAIVVSSFGYTSGITDEHLVLDAGASSDRWLVKNRQLEVRRDSTLLRTLPGR